MSPTKPLFALTATLGLLLSAGTALAQTVQTCQTDTDCQHGYICQAPAPGGTTEPACPADADCSTSGTGGAPVRHDPTTSSPVPTGGTGTAPLPGAGGGSGADAPAVDGGTSGPGTTTDPTIDPTTSSPVPTCQPAPCTTDSDCATGMVCHSEMFTTCIGAAATPPCEPNTKCETPPPTCSAQTVSTCTFKWALPCNADADCGDGFSC